MLGTYAIISPVRNEEKFLSRTLESIINQQIRPVEWIIIDDGSSDRTLEIAQAAAAEHSWIKVFRRTDRGFREPGRGVVEAFNEGLSHLSRKQAEFVCKMDGDLEFGSEYFVTLLREFRANPRLGMASGNTYIRAESGKLIMEKAAPGFVVGPIKMYRRACFEDIGGLEPHLGWDSIDVYRSRMRGWETQNFPGLQVIHLRTMGTAKGIVWGKMRTGYDDYYLGYHPLFMFVRCLYRMSDRPLGINGIAIGLGYLRAWLTRKERIADAEFIAFVRAEQRARLLRMFMSWRRGSSNPHTPTRPQVAARQEMAWRTSGGVL